MRCQAFAGGKYDLMSGREELMVESLAVGVKGFIGSQFNYGGDIYNSIYAEEDMEKRNAKQLASIELLEDWINGVPDGVDGNKLLVNIAGVPVGPARMPSLPPSAEDEATLKGIVKNWCTSYASVFEISLAICEAVDA